LGHLSHKFDIQEQKVEEYEIVEETEGDLLGKKIEVSGLSLSHSCGFTGLCTGRLKCCWVEVPLQVEVLPLGRSSVGEVEVSAAATGSKFLG